MDNFSERKTREKAPVNPWVELLTEIWTNRVLVVFALILSGVLGVFVAMWMRPVYEANALMQVKVKGGSLSAMLGDVGALLGVGGSSAETETNLMQSRRILEEVIDSLGLRYNATPESFLDRILHREGRVDVMRLSLPDSTVLPPERLGMPWTLVADDSTHFTVYDDLDVKVLSGTPGELVSVPYMTDSVKILVPLMQAREGQRFVLSVSSMISAIKTVTGNLSISEKGKKTGLLNIAYQDEYIDRAVLVIDTLAAAYLRLNGEFGSFDMKNTLALLEEQLPTARKTLDSLMTAYNDYREKIGSADIAAETKISLESQVRLQQQILQLEQVREERARLFDASHPTITTLDKQILALKREMSKSNSATKKLPEAQQKILTMTAEIQFAQTIYSDLMKRVEQMRLLVAGTQESAMIIDPAVGNPKPVKPKKKMVVLAFLFIGFCASIGIISLRKKLQGVVDSSVLSNETGVSVYACIEKGDRESEQGIRTLLLSLSLESAAKNRVFCFSGVAPQVGNSFVACRTARAFAASGKRVLLVDADLQNGMLSSHFNLGSSEGLVEILAEKTSMQNAICKTDTAGLDVLPSGERLLCAEGVFASNRFANFIRLVRDSYDIVILDAPSLQNAKDAASVGRSSDKMILTAEYGRHSIEKVQEALSALPDEVRSVVFVLNKFVKTKKKNRGIST
jgi:tyrosine-protein kinase Etk/Wzc